MTLTVLFTIIAVTNIVAAYTYKGSFRWKIYMLMYGTDVFLHEALHYVAAYMLGTEPEMQWHEDEDSVARVLHLLADTKAGGLFITCVVFLMPIFWTAAAATYQGNNPAIDTFLISYALVSSLHCVGDVVNAIKIIRE